MALRLRRRHRVTVRTLRADVVTALGVAAVAVLLPLATFLVAAWLQGWQLQAVQSASMEPTYRVGSLLVIEATDASNVQAGMPLVYEDPTTPGRLVVHRVLGRAPGDQIAFWTQGDANSSRDPVPVPARMVRGEVSSRGSRGPLGAADRRAVGIARGVGVVRAAAADASAGHHIGGT